jgi:glucose/arabinose dehydrogenase
MTQGPLPEAGMPVPEAGMPVPEAGTAAHFCDLPGSLRFTSGGVESIPGTGLESLSFLSLPAGYCAHWFANVGNTRQLRFAPGGELFVASPTTGTTGGGRGGHAAIVILPDDDHDGVADQQITFLGDLPSTQGLLFTNDSLYYQDGTRILRLPYAASQRTASGTPELVSDITVYLSGLHWPKTLDQADDGTLYVSNGGDQNETCDPSRPFRGGILKLDGTPGGNPVARGFRNPIAVRCQRGHDLCFAAELATDYTATAGGREKLVPIRQGDDLGFPCCFSKDFPQPGGPPGIDCSHTTAEDVSFLIGDTPFGLDFEPGVWAAPFTHSVFVVLHGEAGSWHGAAVVAVDIDSATGLPKPASSVPGASPGGLRGFASGWDDGTRSHGRPSAVAFAADGRLFIGNDNDGTILWVAPLEL